MNEAGEVKKWGFMRNCDIYLTYDEAWKAYWESGAVDFGAWLYSPFDGEGREECGDE